MGEENTRRRSGGEEVTLWREVRGKRNNEKWTVGLNRQPSGRVEGIRLPVVTGWKRGGKGRKMRWVGGKVGGGPGRKLT